MDVVQFDEEESDIIAAGMFLTIVSTYKKKPRRQRRKRRWSVRPINTLRYDKGQYHALFKKIKDEDPSQFFKYTRMTVPIFNLLLSLVSPKIKKRSMKTALNPEHRLAMTLLYLSQVCSMQVIAWSYFVGKSTVSVVIKETCTAIWEILAPIYSNLPNFELISRNFETIWQFPNCCGALDGKHINIQAPNKSGSKYFNYKKNFSIVLMATCDANYNFSLIDIGAFGSQSDGGTFRNSTFGRALENGHILLPNEKNLPNTNVPVPHCLVADEAFPLKSYIMRPYPGCSLDDEKRIYNYRLSRARRTIENTFGILVSRWRIFRSNIVAKVETVEKIVAATICLHNFIRKEEAVAKNQPVYCPNEFLDSEDEFGNVILGEWRNQVDGNQLRRLGRVGANYSSRETNAIREKFKDYFVSENGAVPWQWNHINRVG